jgi:hypothetical protein
VRPETEDLSPVTQYLGVPYGVAPSGQVFIALLVHHHVQYRFNMAISAAKWTHMPKEASRLAAACIQTSLPELSDAKLL